MDVTRRVHIGLVQMRCEEDLEVNLKKALRMTREIASQGAAIVCLPELFRSRYFCQTEDHENFRLAESVPGPTTQAFGVLAEELEIGVIVSLFERRAAGLYHNTAAVIDGKRGYLGKYRKMHIPDDPRYFEKFYFTPGDLGFRSFSTAGGTLGVLVCWDQWYPEAARLTALQGAEILFYPTAIGWHPEEKERFGERQHTAWELSQRAHAVANGCYVVAVNRTGFEPTPGKKDQEPTPGIEFWGQSFVAAPDGSILARAPIAEEAIMVVPIELAQLETTRTHWPFLRDRRIDAYGGITERYIDRE
ncbi:MAG: carbon-nitrogen hydrolase [Pseudomonadota bacterium]|nr:carbon-nitrogen hydrolase [Pseudomonadota bacterium]